MTVTITHQVNFKYYGVHLVSLLSTSKYVLVGVSVDVGVPCTAPEITYARIKLMHRITAVTNKKLSP